MIQTDAIRGLIFLKHFDSASVQQRVYTASLRSFGLWQIATFSRNFINS